MGNGFQQGRDRSNAGSLLESARLLTSNATELMQCARISRAHIAAIRSQIEQIRISAALAQRGDLQAPEAERSDAALQPQTDSSLREPHDPHGNDPQGRAVIMTALLVVLIGIISRASRRHS